MLKILFQYSLLDVLEFQREKVCWDKAHSFSEFGEYRPGSSPLIYSRSWVSLPTSSFLPPLRVKGGLIAVIHCKPNLTYLDSRGQSWQHSGQRVQSWFHQTRKSCFSWSEISLGAFWQTPCRLPCPCYWPLYHKALIGGVLQRWLSFWKVLPSPQRNSRPLSVTIGFLVTSLTKFLLPYYLIQKWSYYNR